MTHAPSIKEALKAAMRAFKACRPIDRVACQDFGMQQDDILEQQLEAALSAALATFQPDGERREAIARLATRFWSIHPKEIQDMGLTREQFYVHEMTNLLASGLVQNEAGILKAMEQECWTLRCVDIPTGGGDADVGWEVIRHHQAEPYERMIAHGRTPQEALNAAIRSARDGGAES